MCLWSDLRRSCRVTEEKSRKRSPVTYHRVLGKPQGSTTSLTGNVSDDSSNKSLPLTSPTYLDFYACRFGKEDETGLFSLTSNLVTFYSYESSSHLSDHFVLHLPSFIFFSFGKGPTYRGCRTPFVLPTLSVRHPFRKTPSTSTP